MQINILLGSLFSVSPTNTAENPDTLFLKHENILKSGEKLSEGRGYQEVIGGKILFFSLVSSPM